LVGRLSKYKKSFIRAILAGSLLGLGGSCVVLGQAVQPAAPESEQYIQATLQRAVGAIREQPAAYEQFDYIMTGRVRLLLFWAGADDVGGGYIRRAAPPNAPSSKMFQLVIGSDPAKAPRAINRWGAAWEMLARATDNRTPESSTFFGFMKVSSGTSISAMQKELASEKQAGSKFMFSATISEAKPSGSFAKVVPFPSDQDFTIHQLDQAAPAVFDRLAVPGGVFKSVDASQMKACGRSEGFLSTISDFIDSALKGQTKADPLCYIFNGDRFSLKLSQVTRVPQETVQLSLHEDPKKYVRTYHDLLLLHFDNYNETMKKPSSFELLVGTSGKMRGMPVRITYQPNWWFQVVLNVKMPETAEFTAAN
jgi:hypothetical protein